MNTPASSILQLKRLIRAPRERVCAAFISPADLVKWMGPGPCRCLQADVEPRVGGSYRLKMQTESFGTLTISGTYREVLAPQRLAFTWNWSGDARMEIGETLVTVEFREVGEATEVRITHTGFPAAEARDGHDDGWEGSLTKLVPHLSPGEGAPPPPPLGQFAWNELLARDTVGAAQFYAAVFGWKTEPFGPGEGGYEVFMKGTTGAGGLMKVPCADMPSHWLAYVAVEDCDAAVARATAAGGTVLLPPMEVPTVGRIAVIADPQGAKIGVYRSARG